MSSLPIHDLTQLRAQCAELERERNELLREREVMNHSLELHERDRQLLAFEIHDGIVQDMSASVMLLDSAARQIQFETPAAKELYEQAVRTLRESGAEARRLIRGLIPVVLDEAGFVASLQKLVLRFQNDYGLQVAFQADVQLQHLAPAFEMIILRVVQEALNNVWRHSQCRQADVQVQQLGSELLVRIADQGLGFEPGDVKPTRYGLTGMQERARMLGGATQIVSHPGQGTKVEMQLPLARAVLDDPFAQRK
ncbi:Oxygen sensor histidine kinase NreB [Anatilimnocola aggregata]|uniref:histidine kinase n=1 Tax=Anatilimnocola aggregata TaxID=2528021 RepID=A0A517YM13_9BACT|nr:sensor histidine kinase [Anatilimnocola aggregata]QDU31265.1 Oxygen sensor histidine kinase NreB [Anatilimnocola aggregata]